MPSITTFLGFHKILWPSQNISTLTELKKPSTVWFIFLGFSLGYKLPIEIESIPHCTDMGRTTVAIVNSPDEKLIIPMCLYALCECKFENSSFRAGSDVF